MPVLEWAFSSMENTSKGSSVNDVTYFEYFLTLTLHSPPVLGQTLLISVIKSVQFRLKLIIVYTCNRNLLANHFQCVPQILNL